MFAHKLLCRVLVMLLALPIVTMGTEFKLLILGDSIASGVDGNVFGETVGHRDGFREDLYWAHHDGAPSSVLPITHVGTSLYNGGSSTFMHSCMRGAWPTSFYLDADPDGTPSPNWPDYGNRYQNLSGWGDLSATPDAVVIQCGINRILNFTIANGSDDWTTGSNNTDQWELFERLNSLIDEVQSKYSEADIFICNITNVSNGTGSTYNSTEAAIINGAVNSVNAIVSSKIQSGVTIVDINSVVSASELVADKVHPNASGEDDIAQKIFSTMETFYAW